MKCAICDTEQIETGKYKEITIRNGATGEVIETICNTPIHNIEFVSNYSGKNICNKCQDIYNKIQRLKSTW